MNLCRHLRLSAFAVHRETMAASSDGAPSFKQPEKRDHTRPPHDSAEEGTDSSGETETETETDSDESGSTEYESTSESEGGEGRRAGSTPSANATHSSAPAQQLKTAAAVESEARPAKAVSSDSESETGNEGGGDKAGTSTRSQRRETRSSTEERVNPRTTSGSRSDSGNSSEGSARDEPIAKPRRAAQPPGPAKVQTARRTRFTEEIEGDVHAAAAKARARSAESRSTSSASDIESSPHDRVAAKPPARRPTQRPTHRKDSARVGSTPSSESRPPDRAASLDAAEKGRGGNDTARKRATDDVDACCAGCCSCGGCESCQACCTSMIRSRFWSWLRRRSAYIVATIAGLGMVGAGLTGVIDWWTFCSVGGYDLGGLGYCQR